MCNVLLPPGVNPTAVNKKYINTYIISDAGSYIHVTHNGMLKMSKEDYCQWRIMAALMQPFKFVAAAVFCRSHLTFNSGTKGLKYEP
jgi:hypothetical protein